MNYKDRILGGVPLVKKITLPDGEMGGEVCIRRMSMQDRSVFLSWVEEMPQKGAPGFWDKLSEIGARKLALCLCDEQGVLIFDHNNKDDMASLVKSVSGIAGKILGDEIDALNTLSGEAAAAGKSPSATTQN
ncbi:hypothetical protein [Zavarzinella formosa]|uniref:hypothetical protein n=1 Tax=Zavarzinella formosa TaxID=360055 RepID=UPI0012FC24DA|nr:hypothetical protein [Zavarzinella formosa]